MKIKFKYLVYTLLSILFVGLLCVLILIYMYFNRKDYGPLVNNYEITAVDYFLDIKPYEKYINEDNSSLVDAFFVIEESQFSIEDNRYIIGFNPYYQYLDSYLVPEYLGNDYKIGFFVIDTSTRKILSGLNRKDFLRILKNEGIRAHKFKEPREYLIESSYDFMGRLKKHPEKSAY